MCDTKTLPHCFVWLKSDIFYLPGYTCFGFQSLINIWLNIKQMETRSGWSMIWDLNLDLPSLPRPNIYQTIWPPWILQKTYRITFLNGSRINYTQANPLMKKSRTGHGVCPMSPVGILASDWSMCITWPEYWPLIHQDCALALEQILLCIPPRAHFLRFSNKDTYLSGTS